jgi:hypothetical protein
MDDRVHEEITAVAAMGALAIDARNLRAEMAPGLRRVITALRGQLAGLARRIPAAEAAAAAACADVAAAHANATASAATAAAAAGERDAARALAATRSADLAALQQIVSDLRRDLAAAAAEREELRRRAEAAEVAAAAAGAAVADPIARKVATPLTTPLARVYLRVLGFPAGSQPAGITWGIDTVPAGRLTASSVHSDSRSVHPGCRLLYPDGAVEGKNCFATKFCFPAGEWVRVDLGGERSVVGALVQSDERTDASAESNVRWHRHKFQWSADGAAWADVDGGRVWSRDGLAWKDVSAAVFGAPVRCRYLRIVAVSLSGWLRWEVVVLP